MMRLLSAAIAFALASAAAGAAASNPAVPIALTVFPCATDAGAPPNLTATKMQRPPSRVQVTPAWQRSGAVWNASIALDAGRYWVKVDSQHCSGQLVHWMAIPGATRHLTLVINKLKSWTLDEDWAPGIIYGYLPAPGSTVEVMRADNLAGETWRTVSTDGDSYQTGYLRAGPYVVRITFGDVVVSRAVTLGHTFETMTVRADLTTADASRIVQQQASGSRWVHAVSANHVRITSLQLGAASANGWTTAQLAPAIDAQADIRAR